MQSKNAKFLGLGCVGAVAMMCLCIGAFALIGGDSAASPRPTRRPTRTPRPTPQPTAMPTATPIQMPTLPPARVPLAYFADTCMFPANTSDSLELDGTIRFEWIVAPPGSTISLLIHRASDGEYVGSIVNNGASIGEAEIEIGAGVYQIMAVCEEAVFDITITKAGQ